MLKNEFILLDSVEDVSLQISLTKDIDDTMTELDEVYQELANKMQEIEGDDEDSKNAYMYYIKNLLVINVDSAKDIIRWFLSEKIKIGEKLSLSFITKLSVLFNELLENKIEYDSEIDFALSFVGVDAEIVDDNTVIIDHNEKQRIEYFIGLLIEEIVVSNGRIGELSSADIFEDFKNILDTLQKGVVLNSILEEISEKDES